MSIDNDQGDNRHPLAIALGQIISERRAKRGWTTNELAQKTRLLPQVLELIESGDCLPHTDDLDRLARCMGHSSCAPFLLASWLLSDVTAEQALAS